MSPFRNAIAPLLVTGVGLFGGGDAPRAEGQETVRTQRDIEGILKAMPRMTRPELARYLDDDDCGIRDGAEKYLGDPVMHHIRTRGRVPDLSCLTPVLNRDGKTFDLTIDGETIRDLSFEQTERLWGIRGAADAEATEHILVPSACDVPKEPVPLGEFIETLERQTGYRISMPHMVPEERQLKVISQGSDIMQAIFAMKTENGKRAVPMKSRAEEIELVLFPEDAIWMDHQDGIIATLNPDTGFINLYADPKADLRKWSIKSGFVASAKGHESIGDVMFGIGNSEKGSRFPVSRLEPRAQSPGYHVDMSLGFTPMRKYVMGTAPQSFRTRGGYEFSYRGIAEKHDEPGKYTALLSHVTDHNPYFDRNIICEGSKNGVGLDATSLRSTDNSKTWGFDGSPDKVTLFIPDGIRDTETDLRQERRGFYFAQKK